MRAISAVAIVLAATSTACGVEESISPADRGVTIYVGTVTAEDGVTTNEWTITVNEEANDEAEFHGEFVDFQGMNCNPKPV